MTWVKVEGHPQELCILSILRIKLIRTFSILFFFLKKEIIKDAFIFFSSIYVWDIPWYYIYYNYFWWWNFQRFWLFQWYCNWHWAVDEIGSWMMGCYCELCDALDQTLPGHYHWEYVYSSGPLLHCLGSFTVIKLDWIKECLLVNTIRIISFLSYWLFFFCK